MTTPRSIPTNRRAGTEVAAGLSSAEALARRAANGPNALPEKPGEGFAARFSRQFRNPLIYILLFALVVDLFAWYREGAHGWPVESLVIGLILAVNAILGVWQESKAEAALARLRKLAAPKTWVLRDGEWQQLESSELVEGDRARVEAGDRVPADGLLSGGAVLVDESLLTGESLPVEKETGDELLSGTLLARGKAFLEVTRTGPRSALGKLAGTLGSLREEATPLERRMEAFGARIARWVLVLCGLLALEGLATQGIERWGEVFLFAVALAVAAVPEGLPAVMTLTLALGVERMASRKAVVRRLAAVEALGSVTVIVTDKTGTLTENRLQVKEISRCPDEAGLMRAIVCANDADGQVGDPLDLALLEFARARDIPVEEIRGASPRHSERAFDSGHRYQRVTVSNGPNGELVSYLKGALEALLERSTLTAAERSEWSAEALRHAGEGLRVIAVGYAAGERDDSLTLLGLVNFWDPPRKEAAAALTEARRAGIRVVMMTGDHPATAAAIGKLVGFEGATVVTGTALEEGASTKAEIYARARPEHKLKLVEELQKSGEIVAMTGDGVNDSPALKRADIGVAMGQRGSDVSREVADVVLLDDNFATIVAAVEEGRSIYENTQKFIRFLFSTNLSEVIVIALGVLFSALLGLTDPATGGVLLPLTAAQVLWINLVTDGLPALALTLDRNPGVMSRPPRPPSAPLLDQLSMRFVIVAGVVKAMIALSILGLALPGWIDQPSARTAMFHFMAIGQLLFAYPARHTALRPLPNYTLHAAVAAGAALQLAVNFFPGGRLLLGLAPIDGQLWGVVFGAALLAWALAEAINRVLWRR